MLDSVIINHSRQWVDLKLKNNKIKRNFCFRDYLLGFHKRKVERQKKAKEQILEQAKKEKKEIKKKVITQTCFEF